MTEPSISLVGIDIKPEPAWNLVIHTRHSTCEMAIVIENMHLITRDEWVVIMTKDEFEVSHSWNNSSFKIQGHDSNMILAMQYSQSTAGSSGLTIIPCDTIRPKLNAFAKLDILPSPELERFIFNTITNEVNKVSELESS